MGGMTMLERRRRWRIRWQWWVARTPSWHDILFLIGLLVLIEGLHLVWEPLPWLVGGVGLMLFALRLAPPANRPPANR